MIAISLWKHFTWNPQKPQKKYLSSSQNSSQFCKIFKCCLTSRCNKWRLKPCHRFAFAIKIILVRNKSYIFNICSKPKSVSDVWEVWKIMRWSSWSRKLLCPKNWKSRKVVRNFLYMILERVLNFSAQRLKSRVTDRSLC